MAPQTWPSTSTAALLTRWTTARTIRRHPCGCGATMTGTGERLITSLATLPRTARASAPRPRLPITMASQPRSSVSASNPSAAAPVWSTWSALSPANSMRCRAASSTAWPALVSSSIMASRAKPPASWAGRGTCNTWQSVRCAPQSVHRDAARSMAASEAADPSTATMIFLNTRRLTAHARFAFRDAVGAADVADAVDFCQDRAQVVEIADLQTAGDGCGAVAFDARRHRGGVGLLLGKNAHDVLQEPGTIERFDLDIHQMRIRERRIPAHLDEALGVHAQTGHVGAVDPVHGDAFALRNEAHDPVARYWSAAAREAHGDVVGAADPYARSGARRRLADGLRLPLQRQRHDLLALGLIPQAVDERGDRDVAKTDARVEILDGRAVEAGGELGHELRRGQRSELAARELSFEHLAAGRDVLLAPVLPEPLFDLVLGTRRLADREPVERGALAALVDERFADVAVAQLVVQRHDLAADLRADAVMPDRGVHVVGEVKRRGAGREAHHVALWREDEDLAVEEIELEAFHELAAVAHVLLPFEQGAQPRELAIEVVACPAFLVPPVGRDAVLARAMHLNGAYLDLDRVAARADHGRVQGLVSVRLGHGDVIFEAPGQRRPQTMDDADRSVAVLDRFDDDADGAQVIDLGEILAVLQLLIDGEEMLRPA